MSEQSSQGFRLSPEFDHVPTRVREILRETGGIPGYTYAIVLCENAGEAWRRGWDPVWDQPIFCLVGEKGRADFQLWCLGQAIQGASTASGARALVADPDIAARTGLAIPGTKPVEPNPAPSAAIKGSKGRVAVSP